MNNPRQPRPDSPCINICVMHPRAGICAGCLRTLDEIASWGSLSDAQRRMIMAELPARKPLLKSRRKDGDHQL